MAINAKEIIAAMPEADQKRIKERAARIIAREYSSPVESVEFEFTLTLDGIPQITPEIVAALDDAGCADALLSSRDGLIVMDFIRAAPSREAAIVSAITDIDRANVGARAKFDSDAAQDELASAVNSVLAARASIGKFPKLLDLIPTASIR